MSKASRNEERRQKENDRNARSDAEAASARRLNEQWLREERQRKQGK